GLPQPCSGRAVSDSVCNCSFNVGKSGAKVFSGPVADEFGYTVRQFQNHQGKWLLVGSPWSGYKTNRKGDVYKCEIPGSKTTCERLNLQNSVNVAAVNNINTNMSLGLTLIETPKTSGFMTCGPLWAQQCGSQYYYPGICTEVTPLFQPLPSFSPAIQKCGGPMDIVIVLDGSNSIWPWPPVVEFLKKLLGSLEISPSNTQVSIIQYAVDSAFEFQLNTYKTKAEVVNAAAGIAQMQGTATNTFHAIDTARKNAFLPENGGRPGATKVMVVVTDGESHDKDQRDEVIKKCEDAKITRFGIAVLGYYLRNDIDTKNLIMEIKSIASSPSEKYFFNVSAEEALLEIAGTLGDRIFNLEGTGKGGDSFQMEMSQVGFSAHYSSMEDVLMLGAVGAYAWSGTVVHQTAQKSEVFPKNTFENILEDRNDSSLLGYSVTTLVDTNSVFYVAGAPRSRHTGQVVVYTVDNKKQPKILTSQRGDQIGSYFGSVLCPLDVDKDSVSDLLLVGAPTFMSELKKEIGKVYVFSVSKGILTSDGSLVGPSSSENARFGMAIAAAPDLNLDGFNDVVVGAPLEDSNRGVLYVFNGDKKFIRKQYSQKILGSELDPKLQYFGRSLNVNGDLNDDSIPDVSIGAYGKVVQLWSKRIASVKTTASFNPENINILNKITGLTICTLFLFFPAVITCNLTLDADLLSYRAVSRGLFSSNNERFLKEDITLHSEEIPFTKDCGSDDVCDSDLVLNVNTSPEISSPLLVSFNNRRLSFEVLMENKLENAYNARVITTYSENLFYASIIPPSDGTEVKCTPGKDSNTLSCQVGYPVLKPNDRVTFGINFDFNLNERQKEARVSMVAESDSKEKNAADNTVTVSIPVLYDSEVILTRYKILFIIHLLSLTIEKQCPVFPSKVSTGNFPVSLAYLIVSLPVSTRSGNPLLYITGVLTDLVNPLKIGREVYTPSFSKESLRGIQELDCKTAKCESMKCVFADMDVKRDYFVNITTRIWNGTFASATKPGEKGDLPIGVIVGSVIGGLLLLALAVLLLWKVRLRLLKV
uniref:Integrin subunit alpha 2 n=1 Tax=Scleropages formosus TaxID=113540 RepID=A0A8D0CGE5_SCLFO